MENIVSYHMLGKNYRQQVPLTTDLQYVLLRHPVPRDHLDCPLKSQLHQTLSYSIGIQMTLLAKQAKVLSI